MVRLLLALAFVGLVGLWPATAAGAEAVVELERPADATCVSEDELRRALERSGIALATAGSEPGESVRVSIEGTPSELTVVVQRAGMESSERLAPATCETATDVVAAFVVSAVAPAPVVPVEPPATTPPEMLDLAALERMVRDELDHQEVHYAKRGITLTFAKDAASRFLVRLDKSNSPECRRSIVLGAFDNLADPELRRITRQVIDGIRQVERCLPGTWQERARWRHLSNELDSIDGRQSQGVWASGVLLGVGSIWLITLAVSEDSNYELGISTREGAFATTAGVAMTLGGTAGLVFNEDYRHPAIMSASAASTGALWAWVTEIPDDPRTRYAATGFFAGGLSTGGLITLNAALRRPRVGRLLLAQREFERRLPSAARLVEVEGDLRSLHPPIPNWIAYSPMLVAGAVGFVPAIRHGFDRETTVAALGGLFVVLGGLRGFARTPWGSYQSHLEHLGLRELSLGPGPGDGAGLTLSGKF